MSHDSEWWQDRYYEVAAEGADPEEFVRRALGGEWGPPDKKALLQCLDAIEAIILANIEVHSEEAPGLDPEADEAHEYWSERFARARALLLAGLDAR